MEEERDRSAEVATDLSPLVGMGCLLAVFAIAFGIAAGIGCGVWCGAVALVAAVAFAACAVLAVALAAIFHTEDVRAGRARPSRLRLPPPMRNEDDRGRGEMTEEP